MTQTTLQPNIEYIPIGDPTAGGNDNLFLGLKDKAAEDGLMQKTEPSQASKQQAQNQNQKQQEKDEDGEIELIDADQELQNLLDWILKNQIEITDADHEYMDGLPESVKNARSRRQIQIAIQALMMMQIQAYFQMQTRPNAFTPQQIASMRHLIAQLMEISKNPELKPDALKNLTIARDPAALLAVTLLREQLQQLGAVPSPLRNNDMMLQLGQKLAGQTSPALQNILAALANVKGAEPLSAEAQKIQKQLQLLQTLNPQKNPAQSLMAILQHLRQNGGAAPLNMTQAQLKSLIANINTPQGKMQLSQLIASLTRQSVQNLVSFQNRLQLASLDIKLPPAVQQVISAQAIQLSQSLRVTIPPVLLQQINTQLRQIQETARAQNPTPAVSQDIRQAQQQAPQQAEAKIIPLRPALQQQAQQQTPQLRTGTGPSVTINSAPTQVAWQNNYSAPRTASAAQGNTPTPSPVRPDMRITPSQNPDVIAKITPQQNPANPAHPAPKQGADATPSIPKPTPPKIMLEPQVEPKSAPENPKALTTLQFDPPPAPGGNGNKPDTPAPQEPSRPNVKQEAERKSDPTSQDKAPSQNPDRRDEKPLELIKPTIEQIADALRSNPDQSIIITDADGTKRLVSGEDSKTLDADKITETRDKLNEMDKSYNMRTVSGMVKHVKEMPKVIVNMVNGILRCIGRGR